MVGWRQQRPRAWGWAPRGSRGGRATAELGRCFLMGHFHFHRAFDGSFPPLRPLDGPSFLVASQTESAARTGPFLLAHIVSLRRPHAAYVSPPR